MAVNNEMVIGFDCDFIKKPPIAVQSECPICLQVLREPYQATCCGNSFCKECIHRIKATNQSCPTCNDKDFTLFHNKGLQQSLYDCQVYCTHKSKGCEWTGELRELDNHLNSDPPADKYLQGCPFTFIKCPLSCADSILRKDIKSHLSDNLDRLASRIISIKQENAQLKVQMGEHNGKINRLESKNEELEKKVKKTNVESEKEVKETNERLSSIEGYNQYLEQQVAELKEKTSELDNKKREFEVTIQQQVTELNAKISELDKKNREYEATIQQLGNMTIASRPPPDQPFLMERTYKPEVGFTMTNFDKYQRDDDEWCSPHFFTHRTTGYKMCLTVFANGYGNYKGSYLSVYVYLMRGEFDDQLKWPFCGAVAIKLLNQEEDKDHVIRSAQCTRSDPIEYGGRVLNAERSRHGWGINDLLPLAELRPKYLKNNCIKFFIQRVEVYL